MTQVQKMALVRRLTELEGKLDRAIKEADGQTMFSVESEMHILRLYLEALDCSTKDHTYLGRKHIMLAVNPEIIKDLGSVGFISSQMAIMCLTKGQCGVQQQ